MKHLKERRAFLKSTAQASFVAGAAILPRTQRVERTPSTQVSDINIVGPKDGYTPEVGTLVSMMNWMRDVILNEVRDLAIKDLDYLHDEDSNTIGGMLWHLAATERFYQINTFDGRHWQGLSSQDDAKWDAASNLGNRGRRQIRGYDIGFYLELLDNVRDFSLNELQSRDDDWLALVDDNFWSHPTNNYCKWFHVVEHESNHNGQIRYLKKRVS